MTFKEIIEILRRNIITPVVISLYALSVLLIVVREFRDAYFVSVVITLNTTFAIIQEIRARRALKRLELLNAPFARLVMPDGTVKHIPFTEVSVGQHLELVPGDDIPADGTITESRGLEVNESMLTGESTAVGKKPKDFIFASSSVSAGTAAFTVTAVGTDTRAGIITNQLRAYVPELTPLQKTINRLITGLTFFALALSGLIVFAYSMYEYAPNVIVKTITSAGTVIIPEGLLLGSTVLLAYGSIRLAKAKVLPQKLSAIEAMALLNVLCVDKTGTLTSEDIALEQVIPIGSTYTHEALKEITGTTASCTGSGSSTSDALIAGLPSHPEVKPLDILAFTSQRKFSGVRYAVQKKHTPYLWVLRNLSANMHPLVKPSKLKLPNLPVKGSAFYWWQSLTTARHLWTNCSKNPVNQLDSLHYATSSATALSKQSAFCRGVAFPYGLLAATTPTPWRTLPVPQALMTPSTQLRAPSSKR